MGSSGRSENGSVSSLHPSLRICLFFFSSSSPLFSLTPLKIVASYLTPTSRLRLHRVVFFWAPTMKWGLVLASISDMSRPVQDLSIPQCAGMSLQLSSFSINALYHSLLRSRSLTDVHVQFPLIPPFILLCDSSRAHWHGVE